MTGNREAAAELERVLFEIKRVIVGQDHMVERLLVALLARGHVLLEGLPGLAKTLAVSTMAEAIGGSFVRLQFTPDLLPSDLVGTRIWRASDERFDTEWGPVFANFVLTDEINRAPAKVQSALLEVMAERQVSIGGTTRPLPEPFLVLATQNPVESEGVYTLPEAQRDRFLMKVVVGYPSPEEELEIIRRMGVTPPAAEQVMKLDDLERLQTVADEVYVDSAISQYAVDLVMATREPAQRGMPELEALIDFGVSPRASLGLIAASRALALLRGRSYVIPQDTFDVTRDVFRHRLMLSYEALAKGLGPDEILNRVLAMVPATAISPIEVERRATQNGGAPSGPAGAPVPGTGTGAPPPSAPVPAPPGASTTPSTVPPPGPHTPGSLAGAAPDPASPGAHSIATSTPPAEPGRSPSALADPDGTATTGPLPDPAVVDTVDDAVDPPK
ncbi:MAG: AAA family ATPase [Acidimicrobiales bacterium]